MSQFFQIFNYLLCFLWEARPIGVKSSLDHPITRFGQNVLCRYAKTDHTFSHLLSLLSLAHTPVHCPCRLEFVY